MASTQVATKQDVEEIVARVVGEIFSTAMQLISERFDKVDARFDAIDARFDKLENKLERTADTVDHHTIDIRALQRKAD